MQTKHNENKQYHHSMSNCFNKSMTIWRLQVWLISDWSMLTTNLNWMLQAHPQTLEDNTSNLEQN